MPRAPKTPDLFDRIAVFRPGGHEWAQRNTSCYLRRILSDILHDMELKDFLRTLGDNQPPDGLSPALRALWLDRKGNWAGSHTIAQDIDTPDGAWVHAYLHRKEGDLWNADYWYRRAGRTRPAVSLEREWDEIVNALLAHP